MHIFSNTTDCLRRFYNRYIKNQFDKCKLQEHVKLISFWFSCQRGNPSLKYLPSVFKTCLDLFAVRYNANVNVLDHQKFSDHYSFSLSFPIKRNLDEGLATFRETSLMKSSDLVDKFFLLNHRLKDFKISSTMNVMTNFICFFKTQSRKKHLLCSEKLYQFKRAKRQLEKEIKTAKKLIYFHQIQ